MGRLGEEPNLNNTFPDNLEQLFLRIRPHGRPYTTFPENLVDARVGASESLHDWFRRLVDNSCQGDTRNCEIEENIALFGEFSWSNKKEIEVANVTVLVLPIRLDDYYFDGPQGNEESYFRLDYDTKTLGTPFSHPVPHIHVSGHSSLRFSLDGESGNILIDFIEFIYRHFKPGVWQSWAEEVWNENYLGVKKLPDLDNPFYRLMDAFKESKFGVLQENAANLEQLKSLLATKKEVHRGSLWVL